MADDNNNSGKRVSASAKLPSVTPEGTRRIVAALAETAGSASRQRLASKLGVQLTGAMASSLAAAIMYGFIEVGDDEKLVTTDRGETFLSDDVEAVKRASREAVMSTGFGVIIKRLMTRKADAEVVAFRLQEDQDLPEKASKERAKVVVKAATDSGLVTDDRFDAAAIEDTIEIVGEPSAPDAPTTKPAGSKPAAPKPKAEPEKPKGENPATTTSASTAAGKEGRTSKQEPKVPFEGATAPVQVVLNIDASKLSAKEVAEIVRELRGSTPGS